jgi:hypothetical protein
MTYGPDWAMYRADVNVKPANSGQNSNIDKWYNGTILPLEPGYSHAAESGHYWRAFISTRIAGNHTQIPLSRNLTLCIVINHGFVSNTRPQNLGTIPFSNFSGIKVIVDVNMCALFSAAAQDLPPILRPFFAFSTFWLFWPYIVSWKFALKQFATQNLLGWLKTEWTDMLFPASLLNCPGCPRHVNAQSSFIPFNARHLILSWSPRPLISAI